MYDLTDGEKAFLCQPRELYDYIVIAGVCHWYAPFQLHEPPYWHPPIPDEYLKEAVCTTSQ